MCRRSFSACDHILGSGKQEDPEAGDALEQVIRGCERVNGVDYMITILGLDSTSRRRG